MTLKTVKEQMATDMPAFYDTAVFADAVVYNDWYSIPGLVAYNDHPSREGGAARDGAVLRIQIADIDEVPQRGDTVEIAETTWTVDRILAKDGFEYVLALEKNVRQTFKGR